jgi:hypothetical protein
MFLLPDKTGVDELGDFYLGTCVAYPKVERYSLPPRPAGSSSASTLLATLSAQFLAHQTDPTGYP